MKVYFVEFDGEKGIACFDDPTDALTYLGEPPDGEMRQEYELAKKVITTGKGSFRGEWIHVWLENRTRQWYEGLPELDEEEDQCTIPSK